MTAALFIPRVPGVLLLAARLACKAEAAGGIWGQLGGWWCPWQVDRLGRQPADLLTGLRIGRACCCYCWDLCAFHLQQLSEQQHRLPKIRRRTTCSLASLLLLLPPAEDLLLGLLLLS